MKKTDDFFGEVRWCEEDVANALDVCSVEPSDKATRAVRAFCESHHFTDMVVGAGWEILYQFIEEHRKEFEGGENDA